jgi:hypothetical protein
MTSDGATLFGADGYAESTGNAVQAAVKMIPLCASRRTSRPTAERHPPLLNNSGV